ncbi:hypothetical protein [Lactobacillus delbrueckii]|uniref:hypothetical protein n=1 Tax=Lactobacillus delbrueckii TaxID=1584 RepID=UPI0025B1B411|nr:hypothetical protein [Lactobacillus delbrueckii]
MLNDIIATLLTVGGVGFVNFMVTEQLGTVNLYKDSNQARLGYSLIWSIVDFSIYLLAKNLLSSYLQGDMLLIVVMLITLVGAWLLTYLLAWPLHDLLFTLYSKKAAQHKSKDFLIDNQSVLESTLGIEDKETTVYVYDFEHNPLGYGILSEYSTDENNSCIRVDPFRDPDGETHLQYSYDDLMLKIQSETYQEKYDTRQFIDFKHRFIIIVAIEDSES